jgi:hypothetical protein
LLVFLLQASATVMYFNIPVGYFRSLDRHYLPICVTFGVVIAFGIGVMLNRIALSPRGAPAWIASAAALLLLPGVQLANNWRARDASNRFFTADFGRNVLGELPPNAIFFTIGDNDTFPLWYLQAVEGVRPDVQIVNFSLLFDPTYVEQLIRADPAFPLRAMREPRGFKRYLWGDSTLTIPVRGSAGALGVPSNAAIPSAVSFRPKGAYSDSLMLGDMVLVDLVRTNAWHRPIAFAITMAEGPSWLKSFVRLDGLHFRLVPIEHAAPDAATLRTNLFSRTFRGYADTTVVIDDVTRNIGNAYVRGFEALLGADASGADASGAATAPFTNRCRDDLARMLALIPPGRLGMSNEDQEKLKARCNGEVQPTRRPRP